MPNTAMSVYPKYETYKDSGVEWLGEVPSHWEVVPNRALMRERREKVGKRAPEYTLLSLTLNGVIPRDMVNPQGKFPAEFDTYSVVEPKDLVFCLFDIDETPRAVGMSNDYGMITGAYNVYAPTPRIHPQFIFYYYLSLDKTKALKPLYSGLRKTIQRGVFASAKSPLPPKSEQNSIVAFLDEKTAQIDELIAKKERQIKLLEEQKAIRINQAVTRGLNPEVKLKPSGIEWIGDIPEHWVVVKLRRLLVNIEQGNSPTAVQDDGELDQWKVITLSAVSKGAYKQEAFKPISANTDNKFKNTLADGDLLLTRANTRSLVGDCCIVRNVLINTTFSDLVYRFSPNKRANKSYLLCYLLSKAARAQIERDARGSNETMCKVSHSHIKEWDITLPPPSEQTDIVENLANYQKKHETTLGAIKAQIQSLKTLRSTLIAHAVTGKIRV